MTYKVYISKIEYGSVLVEADSKEEAVDKVHVLAGAYDYNNFYDLNSIDWYDNEVSDVYVDSDESEVRKDE